MSRYSWDVEDKYAAFDKLYKADLSVFNKILGLCLEIHIPGDPALVTNATMASQSSYRPSIVIMFL